MLHVTSDARKALYGMLVRILDQRPDFDPAIDLGLRLVVERSRLGFTLDSPRGGDEVLEQDGLAVLILDSAISEFVENLTLDVLETPDGDRLELRDGG
jgi:hypothetical protein